uniref:DUF4939 domain-containing protein n=1 Tax=Laticauda laticaudata TaxID=8630 RepID=A0A8C5SZ84_LATLA
MRVSFFVRTRNLTLSPLQAHTAPLPQRKCPVAVPDKYDGNQAVFPVFLGQCQLFIGLRAKDFPTDWDKVGFLFNLLTSSAARWAMPLLVQARPHAPSPAIQLPHQFASGYAAPNGAFVLNVKP